VEGNAKKVGKVLFKPISNGCLVVDSKGVNRLISKKIIKRKKTESGDAEECPDVTENGCPAELLSYSNDKRAEWEDKMQASLARPDDKKPEPGPY
jgi:hypothetical protein